MKSSSHLPAVYVPTVKELQALVIPRTPMAALPDVSPSASPKVAAPDPGLSREAEAFLRDAAVFSKSDSTLEERFARIHVTSGSIKKRILQELISGGMIRLETTGRSKLVYLYGKAWKHLGMTPPAGCGEGGIVHRQCVAKTALLFEKKGFDVRLEFSLGPHKKRVDLLALGENRIGVEIGLSSVAQEVKNIEDDLASGALDIIAFCAIEKKMLDAVRKRVMAHPILGEQMHRIRFYLINLEETT